MEQQAEVIADFFTTNNPDEKNRLFFLLKDFIVHRDWAKNLPKFFA